MQKKSKAKKVTIGKLPTKTKKLTKKDAKAVKGGIIAILIGAKPEKPVPGGTGNATNLVLGKGPIPT